MVVFDRNNSIQVFCYVVFYLQNMKMCGYRRTVHPLKTIEIVATEPTRWEAAVKRFPLF